MKIVVRRGIVNQLAIMEQGQSARSAGWLRFLRCYSEWAGEDIGLTTKPRKLNESFTVLDDREADRVHYDEWYTEEVGVL